MPVCVPPSWAACLWFLLSEADRIKNKCLVSFLCPLLPLLSVGLPSPSSPWERETRTSSFWSFLASVSLHQCWKMKASFCFRTQWLTVSKSRVGWGGDPTLLEEDSFKVCLVAILMVYKAGLGWRKSLKPACTKPCVT